MTGRWSVYPIPVLKRANLTKGQAEQKWEKLLSGLSMETFSITRQITQTKLPDCCGKKVYVAL